MVLVSVEVLLSGWYNVTPEIYVVCNCERCANLRVKSPHLRTMFPLEECERLAVNEKSTLPCGQQDDPSNWYVVVITLFFCVVVVAFITSASFALLYSREPTQSLTHSLPLPLTASLAPTLTCTQCTGACQRTRRGKCLFVLTS